MSFKRVPLFLFIFALFAFAACDNKDTGSDSISDLNKTIPQYNPTACTDKCHTAGSALDPVVVNGSGIQGKHEKHVVEKGYACQKCHLDYEKNPAHRDGKLDTGNELIQIVTFDETNKSGKWVKSSSSFSGTKSSPKTSKETTVTCQNLFCHGTSNAPNWYAQEGAYDSTGDTVDFNGGGPGCLWCHSEGSEIDPQLSSGELVAGKHIPHLALEGIKCENCHKEYYTKSSHANGFYGKSGTFPEQKNFVFFGRQFKNQEVTADFGKETGSCSTISCHGGNSGVNWYSNTSGCLACHGTSNSAINPVVSNGEGTKGKHLKHVQERGIDCVICHTAYDKQSTHMNGTFGKLEINNIVSISGEWPAGTGQIASAGFDPDDTKGTCTNNSCHANTSAAEWYTDYPETGGDGTTICLACHVPGSNIDPLITSGNSPDGKHIPHVVKQNISCDTCHKDYMSQTSHLNNKFGKTGNPIPEDQNFVYFGGIYPDPGGSPVSAVFDGNGGCDNITCHGGQGGVNWYTTEEGCAVCHNAGSAIDPLSTSGSSSAGKHIIHVTDRGISCTTCHYDYTLQNSHMNGLFGSSGAPPETRNFVFFDKGASFMNRTVDASSDASGGCNNISCHGGTGSSGNWYVATSGSTVNSACIACHAPGSDFDPLTTSGDLSAGKHIAHVNQQSIDCVNCHQDYPNTANHINGDFGRNGIAAQGIAAEASDFVNMGGLDASSDPVSGDFTKASGGCENVSCHGFTGDVNWYTNGSGCVACHGGGSAIDPITTSGELGDGKHLTHVGSKNIDCTVCHQTYPSALSHRNNEYGKTGIPAKSIPPETDNYISFGGTYNSQSVSADFITGGACNNISCHGGTSGVDWYTLVTGCQVCHFSDATINPLTTSGQGVNGKHSAHFSNAGIACETCHKDYKGNAGHMNGDYGRSAEMANFFNVDASADFLGKPVSVEFEGDAVEGSCNNISCHGNPSYAKWYEDISGCIVCHSTPKLDSSGDQVRRQVLGAGGDFGVNSSITSHHIKGSLDPVSDQCKVCHDLSSHMLNQVSLRNADTSSDLIAYDSNSPAGLEPFCLSCHDAGGATSSHVSDLGSSNPLDPFNEGSAILGSVNYPATSTISESWNKTYGHGSATYRTSQNRLTCAGTGGPGTGCHGSNSSVNAHGSVNEVLAAKEFSLSLASGTAYSENYFSLCFDCHSNYPGKTKEDTLGVKSGGIMDGYGWFNVCEPCHWSFPTETLSPYNTSGTTTRFADHNEVGDPYGLNDNVQFYSGYEAVNPGMNLHWLHLGMYLSRSPRDQSLSLVTCTNCHDVHGSNTEFGALYDVMGYTHVSAPDNSWTYGTMTPSAYGPSSIISDTYPTYCAMNCHQNSSQSRAWFDSFVE